MTNQNPSKEELKKIEDEAIAEAEKLEADPPKEDDEEIETQPTEEQGEETGTEEPQPTPEEEKEKLKTKLSASAREAQKLYAKNRVINKALIDADDIKEPTEDELQAEYKDWEAMSDIEKELAKETVVSRRWRQTISQAKEQATKIEKWNESVDEFVEDPKTLTEHPELEGKTEDFQEYAKREENNSVPMKTLVGAFLYEQTKNGKSNKGRMFETGSGGPNDKPQPKSDKITLDEARKLRETNYAKYKEYLMAGKIDNTI